MPVTFTKVALPYGWLGNMAPYPIVNEGKVWPTAEALFQALRFDDPAVKEAIRQARSPFQAKLIARAHKGQMVVVQRSEQDVENMRLVLRLKLGQHPDLAERLLDTGEESIIEDSTSHPGGSAKFWGAVFKGGAWVGENVLGRLWVELREELRKR
jgi:ribA/ribD-fused uncharacterized protein